MTIKKEMLDILCCPVTKQPVKLLETERLNKLNSLIQEGKIKDIEGNILKESIEYALITTDGKTIYRIDDDIPVMLAVAGIDAAQLG